MFDSTATRQEISTLKVYTSRFDAKVKDYMNQMELIKSIFDITSPGQFQTKRRVVAKLMPKKNIYNEVFEYYQKSRELLELLNTIGDREDVIMAKMVRDCTTIKERCNKTLRTLYTINTNLVPNDLNNISDTLTKSHNPYEIKTLGAFDDKRIGFWRSHMFENIKLDGIRHSKVNFVTCMVADKEDFIFGSGFYHRNTSVKLDELVFSSKDAVIKQIERIS